jgi:hypothetical protein
VFGKKQQATSGRSEKGALKTKNQQALKPADFILKMAGTTRLELATSGVTGRRSNQTELHPRIYFHVRQLPFSDG